MRDYYIFKSGRLRRHENTVEFETAEGKKSLPLNYIYCIHLFGSFYHMGRFDGSGDLLLQKNTSSLNIIQNHSDEDIQQDLAWTNEPKSTEKNVNEISGRSVSKTVKELINSNRSIGFSLQIIGAEHVGSFRSWSFLLQV